MAHLKELAINSNLTDSFGDRNHNGKIISMLLKYEEAIPSWVRETVSNARDANNDAGAVEPIVIHIGRKNVMIADRGLGMSKEVFYNYYTVPTASTKDGTYDGNAQSVTAIGKWGIGAYSPLAYVQAFYGTTNHNGYGIDFVVFRKKDGGVGFQIDFEGERDAPNGTSFNIPLKDSYDQEHVMQAIENQLLFFKDVYVKYDSNPTRAKRFNDRKVYEAETYACCDLSNNQSGRILLGDVIYPSNSTLPQGMFLKFSFDELEIMPTRERIEWVNESIGNYNKKYDAFKKEIVDQQRETVEDTPNPFKAYAYNERITSFSPAKGMNVSFGYYDDVVSQFKGIAYTGEHKLSDVDKVWDKIWDKNNYRGVYQSRHSLGSSDLRRIIDGDKILKITYKNKHTRRFHHVEKGYNKPVIFARINIATLPDEWEKFLEEYAVIDNIELPKMPKAERVRKEGIVVWNEYGHKTLKNLEDASNFCVIPFTQHITNVSSARRTYLNSEGIELVRCSKQAYKDIVELGAAEYEDFDFTIADNLKDKVTELKRAWDSIEEVYSIRKWLDAEDKKKVDAHIETINTNRKYHKYTKMASDYDSDQWSFREKYNGAIRNYSSSDTIRNDKYHLKTKKMKKRDIAVLDAMVEAGVSISKLR